jgi:hypothetical protein
MIPKMTKRLPTKVLKDDVKLSFKRRSSLKHRSTCQSNSKHPLSKWLERLGEMIETSNMNDSEASDRHQQVLKASGCHLYSGSLMANAITANAITCRIPITSNKSKDAAMLLFSRPRKSLKKPRRNAFAIPCLESAQALTESVIFDEESSQGDALWSPFKLAAVLDAAASTSLASLEEEPSDNCHGYTEEDVDSLSASKQLEDALPNVKGMLL